MPTDVQKTGTAMAVGLLAVIALAFAIAGYLKSASNAAWDEFLATTATVSEPSASVQPAGRTGCPRGNRQLPTQLLIDPE